MWLRNFCSRHLPWWKRHPKWHGTLSPQEVRTTLTTCMNKQVTSVSSDDTFSVQCQLSFYRLSHSSGEPEFVSCFRDMHFMGHHSKAQISHVSTQILKRSALTFQKTQNSKDEFILFLRQSRASPWSLSGKEIRPQELRRISLPLSLTRAQNSLRKTLDVS